MSKLDIILFIFSLYMLAFAIWIDPDKQHKQI